MVTKNQRIAGSRKSVCEASSYQTQNTGRRSPRGERGLKFWGLEANKKPPIVAPHAGSVD